MRTDAQPPTGGIYRPRNPRASPLYQCLRRHGDELDAARLIHRPVEGQVLERFMGCGDLHHGFTRIYCDRCRHDYLLAYSCKTRYFCPSCHQKRMLAYGEWHLTRRPDPPWPQAETLPITYHPVPDIA
jgi:hypothetical protein